MVLQTLRLRGFKSFPETIEIAFEPGITAIVGPNGSGKSNVADAIRWVLGEQSAKQLRGAKMDEVIFGGTDTRRPLSFAEVTLTLRNDDPDFANGAEQVAITRRLFRSGESEYLINQNACRLKDIIELLRDTGAGREGYSVIGQGRIDEILSNRAEDRRAVFEEAAGIAKYKARKVEAERKLSNAADSLSRVDDILSELTAQLEPLREQAEAAREYLLLVEELRGLEFNAYLVSHERTQKRLEELAEVLTEAGEREAACAERAAHSQENITTTEQALIAAEAAAAQARENKAAELMRSGQASAQVQVLNERETAARENAARLEESVAAAGASCESLTGQIEAAAAAASAANVALSHAQAEYAAAARDAAELATQVAAQQEDAERARAATIARMNQGFDAKTRAAQLTTMAQSMDGQAEKITAMLQEATARRDRVATELSAARGGHAGAEDLIAHAQRTHADADQAAQATQAARDELRAAEDKLASAQTRLRMFDDLARDLEGVQGAVRSLMRDAASSPELRKRVRGMVSDVLTVPKGLEIAAEMALGGAMQQVITPTQEDAKALIDHLRREQYGRVTFLPLNTIQPRELSHADRKMCHGPGIVGVASDLFTCAPEYRAVLLHLLGRTIVVKDMEAGIALQRQCRSSFRIVTQQGDLFNVGGAITGGSVGSRVGGAFSRRREQEDLRAQTGTLRGEIEALQTKISKSLAAEQSAQHLARDAAERVQEARVQSSTMDERQSILRDNLSELTEQAEQLQSEYERLLQAREELTGELAQAQAHLARHDEGAATGERDSQSVQEAFAALQRRAAAALAQQGERDVARTRAQSAFDAATRELSRLQSALQSAQQQVTTGTTDLQTARSQLAAVQELRANALREAQGVDEATHALTRALEAAEQQRAQALEDYKNAQQEHAHTANDQALAMQARLRAENQTERLTTERETSAARIFENYQMTYEQILPYRDAELATSSAAGRIPGLRSRIRALGMVNVNAVEEVAALTARVEEMTTQREDTRTAMTDLTELIHGLETHMTTKFREAFAQINKAFSECFTKLFGGGDAHLTLQDDSDWLASGIDIAARPPGTKLQSLSLLSGGQRALTAIALLFAMLQINPTPFCVLDEIEAALDEANVSQYAQALHEYTASTQFVVITHRKGTMEAADALYGISMQEKGVSSLVSARFQAG